MYSVGFAPSGGPRFCGHPPDYDPCSAIDEIIARVRPDIEALKAWRAARETGSPVSDPTKPLRFEPKGDAERRRVAAIDREVKARKRAAADAEKERRRVEAQERKRRARAVRAARPLPEPRPAPSPKRPHGGVLGMLRTCACGRGFRTRAHSGVVHEWCPNCRARGAKALGLSLTNHDEIAAFLRAHPKPYEGNPGNRRGRFSPWRDLVLAFVDAHGSITAKQCRADLGMRWKTADHVLAGMRRAGLLVAEGVTWKARNVRPRCDVVAPRGEDTAVMAGVV